MHNYSGDRPAAGRSGSSGAAVAMVARRDLALIELNRIKVSDMGWRTMVHRQIEHLVEVAVVEGAVPTHGDCVAEIGRASCRERVCLAV